MASTGSITALDPLFQQLVDNLLIIDGTKKAEFESQKQTQVERKSAVSSVGTKLTSLNSLLTGYQSFSPNQFTPLAATSSNTDAFTVTSEDFLSTSGSFSIEIQQLAKADVRVGAQFTEAGNQIATAFGGSAGANRSDFVLNVNGSNYTISIGDVSAMTNEEALQEVASAINSAAGTDVQATILRENSNTVRLSVRSRESGTDNEITFSNVDDAGEANIAEILQLTIDAGPNKGQDNATVIASGSTDGGRLFAASELDARFTVDGLNFTRSSNIVDDAITGLTLNLRNTTTATETLQITNDAEAGLEEVNSFIESFNSVITDIRSKSFLNSSSGDRGPLNRDRVFRELTNELRTLVIGNVLDPSVDETNAAEVNAVSIKNIFDIGLNVRQDGTLFIENQAQLDNALADNPELVQNLFSSTRSAPAPGDTDFRSISAKLQDALDRFIRTDGGLVRTIENSIEDRISFLDGRIEIQNEFLERREAQLINEYAQLQVLQQQVQSQFSQLQSIGTNFSFF